MVAFDFTTHPKKSQGSLVPRWHLPVGPKSDVSQAMYRRISGMGVPVKTMEEVVVAWARVGA